MAQSSEAWKRYAQTSRSDEEKGIAGRYEEATAVFQKAVSRVFELIENDKYADAEV